MVVPDQQRSDPRQRVGTLTEAVKDAVSLQIEGRLPEAEKIYAAVIAVDACHFDSLHNLSLIRRRQGRLDESLSLIRRALQVDPNSWQALDSMGNVLLTLNRPVEAIACYERAIALKPDAVEAYSNLGGALVALNRPKEAISRYQQALGYKPDYAEVQYFESLARLTIGDFDDGWRKYEWRWLRKDATAFRRNFAQPLWLGSESLADKIILLHADQGMGCTLQFVRYLPLVAQQAAGVVLEVQRPLVPLLRGLPGVAAICARGDPLPAFDRHCPLLSLPLAFGTTVATIPAEVPYVAVSPDTIARWRGCLAPAGLMSIGLTWAGNKAHSNDYNRSIPLRHLLPLLRLPNLRFVSLQHELRNDDAQILDSMNVMRLGERVQNFAETAAIMSQLNLVITVDTATAHLAGALARPLWVLLPFSADWRWFLDRDDSPFYPTARLFRQPAIDDWGSVIAGVRQALSMMQKHAT